MSHTNNKEVQEIMLGLSTSNKCHLIDGKFYYLESDVKDTLHQELQKAREEERERIGNMMLIELDKNPKIKALESISKSFRAMVIKSITNPS